MKAREELAKANTDIETQSQVVKGKSDTLHRTIFKSPVHGIVKEIDVMTLGGIVPQNGKLMMIVPLDEQLLVQARILLVILRLFELLQVKGLNINCLKYQLYDQA